MAFLLSLIFTSRSQTQHAPSLFIEAYATTIHRVSRYVSNVKSNALRRANLWGEFSQLLEPFILFYFLRIPFPKDEL